MREGSPLRSMQESAGRIVRKVALPLVILGGGSGALNAAESFREFRESNDASIQDQMRQIENVYAPEAGVARALARMKEELAGDGVAVDRIVASEDGDAYKVMVFLKDNRLLNVSAPKRGFVVQPKTNMPFYPSGLREQVARLARGDDA